MGRQELLRGLRRSALARALRNVRDAVRPLPRPRYLPNTPSTGVDLPFQGYFPPNISTLAAGALSPQAQEFALNLLRKLTPNDEAFLQELHLSWGLARFGEHWRRADNVTVLTAASMMIRPKAFLEIGVRRGRSSAAVGSTAPDCAIYGFDLWLTGYGGIDNPGPDFVRDELAKVGHRGPATFVSGDSKRTVPGFLREHPDLFFDIISVDGDHSVAGAARDLANVLPRLKIGGVLVFDDVRLAQGLPRVWRSLVARDGRYQTWQYTESGAGVAAAIRLGQ